MKLSLTAAEVEAIYAATGNIDPCMFEEMPDEKKGGCLYKAWETGRAKLSSALETINARKIVERRHRATKGGA